MNNGNKFKQQKKAFKKLRGISTVIYKAAAAGGIFNDIMITVKRHGLK